MYDDLDYFEIIIENVRQIRKHYQWTQHDLCLEAGLNRTHIGFIEQRRVNPTITTLVDVAWALDVSPALLITPEGYKTITET